MQINQTSNCGTFELDGVREFTEKEGKLFIGEIRDGCAVAAAGGIWVIPGIILFSDARGWRRRSPTKGDLFAQYIRDNRLGTVTEGEWVTNPNTHNKIKFFIWHTHARNIERF